jgi:hypothetical protein
MNPHRFADSSCSCLSLAESKRATHAPCDSKIKAMTRLTQKKTDEEEKRKAFKRSNDSFAGPGQQAFHTQMQSVTKGVVT